MKARRFGAGLAALCALALGAEAHGDDGGDAALRAKVAEAVKRLRAEAAKAEAGLPAARAKVDEVRPKVEAARAAAQAKVDACVAKVDADEVAWKAQLDRCDEQAAAAQAASEARAAAALESCQQRAAAQKLRCEDDCTVAEASCWRANRNRPNAQQGCTDTKDACQARCGTVAENACSGIAAPAASDPCAGLRARGDAFEPRREACRKPLDAIERPLREAEARVSALESESRKKTGEADTVDKLSAAGQVALASAIASGRLVTTIPAGKVKLGETGTTSDVAAFVIDRTEVTVAAYAACVASGKCTPAQGGGACNAGVAGRDSHPINCVDWNQADAYCKAQGLRLPTEEEWEYAATGGYVRTYPWGDDPPSDQLCWDGKENGEGNDKGANDRKGTCPVGAFPKGRSPLEVDDMSGNVWEWTSSPYFDAGPHRVIRGGGWDSDGPLGLRSGDRYGYASTDRSGALGFRCAGSAGPH